MSSQIDFIHSVERLKNELRHSFSSQKRRESVAEHSWRLCLMALILPDAKTKIDKNKCLKMALIHDLPEVFAGDTYQLDLKKQAGRHDREKSSIEKLLNLLDPEASQEIMDLWLEFEEAKTEEARFVRLVDRLEVLIQHNEADISTWDDLEKQIHYGLAAKHAEKYGFLHEFAKKIDEETRRKLLSAGYNSRLIKQEEYDRYYGSTE
jgi:putative hydrolases of HD superfamily